MAYTPANSQWNVLAAVTRACGELGIQAPTLLVGNADIGATQLLALAQAAAEEIVSAGDYGWQILETVYTWTTTQNQSEYPLPADYDRLMIDTVWDRGQLTPMQGPLSPALWQTIKSGLIGNGIYFSRYRVVRSVNSATRMFVVDPPSAKTGETLAFEYQSNAFAQPTSGASPTNQFAADTDVFLLDYRLLVKGIKWKWRQAKQLEWATFLEEYNQLLDTLSARDRPQPGFSMTGPNYRQNFLGWANIPDTGYGNT